MKNVFLTAGVVCMVAAVASPAQTLPDGDVAFFQDRPVNLAYQKAIVVAGPGSQPVMAGMIGADGRMGLLNVTGKPFSATESRHTTQILANGARIERSDSNTLYRDDQGRTRSEQTVDGKTIAVIMDPVAKTVLILNREAKTARRVAIPGNAQQGSVSVANGGVTMLFGATIVSQNIEAHAAPGNKIEVRMAQIGKPGVTGPHTTDDIGTQSVNGVMAKGTREIQTIPAGSIGNDRDLQVVDEHWFSADLGMLVRSVNSDPRFGETTYQLINIVRGAQDPGLFQVPADYTTSDEVRPALPDMKPAK